MKLEIKCRGYEGELISIKPDLCTTYPDGDKKIETYKIRLKTITGDFVEIRNVFPDGITGLYDTKD